ncbi:hypothetical protein ACFV0H_34365 [Streptomyces erythrochromogenes]|uniref:hypothetical protein n=1 Tax=Streptomyces erythrochromogenes TaxID=285574 RepID=UPI00369AA25B
MTSERQQLVLEHLVHLALEAVVGQLLDAGDVRPDPRRPVVGQAVVDGLRDLVIRMHKALPGSELLRVATICLFTRTRPGAVVWLYGLMCGGNLRMSPGI